MDFNTVYDLISNVGFPIAVCAYLLYNQNKEQDAHKAETAGFVTAINNNTAVIQKLSEKLDEMEEKISD